MSKINYQALREAAVAIETVATPQKLLAFRMKVTPQVVLALLDEREAQNKCIAELEKIATDYALKFQKAQDALKHVVLMRKSEQEAADNNLIDSECHVAELEEALRDKQALLEASEKRIAELEAREIKPAKGEVLVVVSGFTGCGKSAIAGEIEIAMKAIGVPVKWTNGDAEKRMTGADWLTAIEMYKPTVRIVEVNVPRAPGIRIKGDAGEQNDEKP
ncbi:ead/Ea22-like family protein [Escherichia coli]|nr:ead/Ea22-like family protein [Escherichia coli]